MQSFDDLLWVDRGGSFGFDVMYEDNLIEFFGVYDVLDKLCYLVLILFVDDIVMYCYGFGGLGYVLLMGRIVGDVVLGELGEL